MKRFQDPFIPLICSILLLGPSLSGAEEESIRFNGYRIDPNGALSRNGLPVGVPAGKADAGRIGFVQSDGPVDEVWKEQLRRHGVELIGYAPPRAYLARLPEEATSSKLDAWIGTRFHRILPEMKIDPAARTDETADPIPLLIHPVAPGDLDRLIGLAECLGATVVGARASPPPRIGLQAPREILAPLLRSLSEEDGVYFIERDRGVRLFNDDANPVLQGGAVDGPPVVWNQGIYGEGEIIAILDTGIDPDSCYFRDPSGALPPANAYSGTIVEATRRKVIAVNFLYSADNPLAPSDPDDPADPLDWDDQGHGTSVAGCAAGGRIDSPTAESVGNGLAPLAKLVIQDGGAAVDDCADLPALGCPVIDLTPIFQQVYDQGARIENGSWGDRENFLPQNLYTARCRDVDAFTRERPEFLCVFAAGNSGDVEGGLGSPSTAKNALSVGATENGAQADQMTGFSSHGPASDGRIKPDLCAPGRATTARSDSNALSENCDVRTAAGTSFASPFTAGAAALVRQYLREGFYPSGAARPTDNLPTPSAALVKAMLIASTVPVVGADEPIPADDQGWGRIRLDKVLVFEEGDRRLWLRDDPDRFSGVGDRPFEASFLVEPGVAFEATLVWSDDPGTVGVEPNLVNDLDLEISSPDGLFRGNRFVGGDSVPGGEPDRLNNVESIRISEPSRGYYHLTVRTAALPEPPQGFALVILGAAVEAKVSGVDPW